MKHETNRIKPLVFCSGYQGAVIDMDYKLYYTKGKYELYNIAKDPSEKNDISAAYPAKKERLEKCLKAVSYTHLDVYKRQPPVSVA